LRDIKNFDRNIKYKSPCPNCNNRLEYNNDWIDTQLIKNKRNIIRLSSITKAKETVEWKCVTCNTTWMATPQSILSKYHNTGCPTCKNKKENIICERRNFSQVNTKFQKEIIFIIWDLFLKEANKRSKIVKKTIDALFTLFTLKYTTGCYKKRRNILYFAISLLCENITNIDEIIRPTQLEILSNILKKIDLVYKQIKKNEISPGTEYLFKDIKSSNLEKTIEKIEKMNTFGETFVPRL
jgi:DNA-directed RNA polymerase subunit RPC12/RpoP